MTIVFAFVAIITNIVVNSKVNALSKSYQNNPVTVATAPQTNTVDGSCTDPAVVAAAAAASGAGQSNVLPGVGGGSATGFVRLLGGSFSQSNTSNTTTTSTNTYIKDSYNSKSLVITKDNNNTENEDSGNTTVTTTTTNTDNSNNSVNTVNTDNSDNHVTNNIHDNGNDNGNTSSVDNSNNVTSTNTQVGAVNVNDVQ